MDSQSAGPDDRLIVGVSLDLANRTIARRIVSAITLLIAAMLVTAGLTTLVVTYALRPLRRVAATAAEVAGTPLIGDDHRITARVQPEDTDPDNEVGIVGHTLNRLLDNVDSALATAPNPTGGCGNSSPTPATNCAPRCRRYRATPSSPAKTAPRCHRPRNTRWPVSSRKPDG